MYVYYCLYLPKISLEGHTTVWLQWCLQGGELSVREQEREGVYFYSIPFIALEF